MRTLIVDMATANVHRTVFCDNGYFQKAIAASPKDALPGYILGGLAWFAIPFTGSTTMGLAAVALESNPSFPTYPNRMSPAEVSSGLTLPYAAIALLGSGGAGATLLIVFMAVTSAMSSELVAVSSIFTYDVYKTYINPNAKGHQLIRSSHMAVVGFGVIMAGFSTGLYYAGVSMGYLYLMMGCIISSAVLPITLTLLWKRMNWLSAVLAPPLGLVCAVGTWLGTAKNLYGELSIDSTGANTPMLVGNVVALCSPIIFIGVLTAIKPDNYDFQSMMVIKQDDDSDQITDVDAEVGIQPALPMSPAEIAAEQESLLKASKIATYVGLFLFFALIILWPMPMYGSSYVFSEHFWTGWVVVSIMWLFFSLFAVGIFPLWESRLAMKSTVTAIWRDATGKGGPRKRAIVGEPVESIAVTPTEAKVKSET